VTNILDIGINWERAVPSFRLFHSGQTSQVEEIYPIHTRLCDPTVGLDVEPNKEWNRDRPAQSDAVPNKKHRNLFSYR
jgi:hypothetical protein